MGFDTMSNYDKDLARRIEGYRTRGWYPVKWAHQPKKVKEVLHYIGLRPQMKQCYANCQRFILADHPNVQEFEYREGYASTIGIHIPHAWLIWRPVDAFRVIDLTLAEDRDVEYFGSLYYSKLHIIHKLRRDHTFGPVSDVALWLVNPLRKQFKEAGAPTPDHSPEDLIRFLVEDGFTKARAIQLVHEHLE